MDPRLFKAPYIAKGIIWTEADSFRKKYAPQGSLPIDIHGMVEFDLGLELRPISNLKEATDVDALLLGDLTTIVIDSALYMDDRMLNRVRYSLAHEVGHLILHSEIYKKIAYSSVEEWINFFQAIPDNEYYWIEQHAYEFAGRLLVPPDALRCYMSENITRAEEGGFSGWDRSGEAALEYISHSIARHFGVSEQVIARRLVIEGFWKIR